MFTAIVFRLPFVVGMLSVGDILRHPNIGKRLIGGFFEKIGLILAHHADVVNVKTLRDKINLINFGFPEDKIVVIPDGIPEDACKPVVVNDLCREYNLDDKKVVLYVGRLQYPKGLHILLKSVPVVLKDVPDAIFLLVGPDGGMKQILMALAKSLGIQNHIIFADYVSEQIKLQAYALCDMLVLPSLYDYVEAYSIVISEAWAQRKPVVATRIGAIPYRINHNVNGLLVPPGDVDKLAGAITKLLLDSSFARHLGENGSKEVVTWSEVAQRMMDIYQNLGNQNLVIETS
jgi:glycosyltransferase involved in cell wall biosynthesis